MVFGYLGLTYRKAVHGGQVERPIDVVRTRLLSSLDPAEQEVDSTIEELKYPWMIQSKSPVVHQVLCGYKDYSTPVSLRQLLYARILEGFLLRTFHVSKREGRRAKIHITLALPWIPGVNILYTVRSTWENMSKSLLEDTSDTRRHRIELNVLAYRQFILLFINLQHHEKPINMYENTLHERVSSLRSFLNKVVDTDGRNSAFCLTFVV